MRVLVVNAGSSSVKIRLLDGDTLVDGVDLAADRGRPDPAELTAALRRFAPVDAVGHRVVHGGRIFTAPVPVDDAARRALAALVPLAPLHQAPALAALDATSALLPGVPAVACFDTAFHADLPAAASTYAVPARWRDEFGVRRYGFHGLAHEWAARRAAALVPSARRVVVAHLGSGASLCAAAVDPADGAARVRSADTTMGFTPTAGLVMGTRCGDLDPAVPLWMVEHARLAVADVAHALDHESGLLGLAGDADMRAVLAAERAGRSDAALAVEVWLHRLRAGIAAMAASLGGLDVLVFSAGIGEHQPELRRRALDGLGFLGLGLDPVADAAVGDDADADVTAGGASARTLVVHAREDLVIARAVRAVLGRPAVADGAAARLPGGSERSRV
ncbi:acetate/propionate family kinase [Pseudonocardia acidicola]|uniref:Acetate kinase n=1 Tax=Pseudonocardia acidicola TaxID=2724939 RepID=A0ABX1S7K5_9PSEU|nr:acetate/propionate family kinase [Pseudonocardia acidicola]NMH97540.1 acetate/propionate family kinase [Pseudonocardia acidicola]